MRVDAQRTYRVENHWRRLARRNLGVTRVLSYQVAEGLGQGLLVRLLSEHDSPTVPVSLVYQGLGRLPMKTRAFIDLAAVQLRARLQATTAEV